MGMCPSSDNSPLTSSHSFSPDENTYSKLHKFVVKVNSVNFGQAGKREKNGLLVLKTQFPPQAECTFLLFSQRSSSEDTLENKQFIPLSESRLVCDIN